MTTHKIFNGKLISLEALKSNVYYSNYAGIYMPVRPFSIEDDGLHAEVTYVRNNKEHKMKVALKNILTQKQYDLQEYLITNEVNKKAIVLTDSDAGKVVAYTLRGIAYNAKIVGKNTDKPHFYIIQYIKDGVTVEKSIHKSKVFTDDQLSLLSGIIKPEKFNAALDMAKNALSEVIIEGDLVNQPPVKIAKSKKVLDSNKAVKPNDNADKGTIKAEEPDGSSAKNITKDEPTSKSKIDNKKAGRPSKNSTKAVKPVKPVPQIVEKFRKKKLDEDHKKMMAANMREQEIAQGQI